MANILVVYGAKSYPLRATVQDHLYCFRRYSEHRCYYFNMLTLGKPWYQKPPRFIQRTKFDLVIFHLNQLNIQWPPYTFEKFEKQAGFFEKMQAVKVALAQDEFYKTTALENFIKRYSVDFVFSLAAESEWQKIYPSIDFTKVKFFRALPGYLDEKRLGKIKRLAKSELDRPITIGYRAVKEQNMHWLGRHGFTKFEIADLFKKNAGKFGIATDISTSAKDVLLGNAWFRFLLHSKYVVATEGGASILDHDGSLRERAEAYFAQHPQASFEEVERACFPGRDDELNYKAISPKHLEACATQTCQILVEGEYNGILKPGVHYMELKHDFSNINQVLSDVKQDHLRDRITNRAFEDIVESGAYTYSTFVHWVLGLALPNRSQTNSYRFQDSLSYIWGRIFEIYQWIKLAIMSSLIRLMRRFLPASFETQLRKFFT
jgi:hypothetical protein